MITYKEFSLADIYTDYQKIFENYFNIFIKNTKLIIIHKPQPAVE